MSTDLKPTSAFKLKSRTLPWLLVAVLAVCVLVAQTISFIAREMPTSGKLQFGSVDLETVITTSQGTEEVIAPEGEKLVTGEADAQRFVRVRNTGDHPLYVRVKLGFTCISANGATHPIDNLVSFAPGDAKWIARSDAPDGYYYLSTPLKPGELSVPLISGAHVKTQDAVNAYGEGLIYTLSANAFGVQSENQRTTNVLDVEGWPAA